MEKSNLYANKLSRMIQYETISYPDRDDYEKFHGFHDLLRELFPHVFTACDVEDFNGSLLIRWKGSDPEQEPILFMNHQDVVSAEGAWTYPPFSGAVTEDKIWGRGALDDKGGLFGMLQAAEELIAEGHIPSRDIYFESGCNEETHGAGSDYISKLLKKRGLHFSLVLDEGGMIVHDPIGIADATFAMIGVGEKGALDLKFTARSQGGHASTPGKNTPLVRLGKFMADVERSNIFTTSMDPAICEMFRRMAPFMKEPLKTIFAHSGQITPVLERLVPSLSPTAAALFRTTLAFTMASGSEGRNVLPQEAYVIGNMRFSHHQGRKASVQAVSRLARKYDIEVEILDKGFSSPITDYKGEAFHLVEKAVHAVFPDIIPTPYLMTGASDSRYFSRVCDHCLRFAPFMISAEQLASIHSRNENLDLCTLSKAVEFYRYLMK